MLGRAGVQGRWYTDRKNDRMRPTLHGPRMVLCLGRTGRQGYKQHVLPRFPNGRVAFITFMPADDRVETATVLMPAPIFFELLVGVHGTPRPGREAQ